MKKIKIMSGLLLVFLLSAQTLKAWIVPEGESLLDYGLLAGGPTTAVGTNWHMLRGSYTFVPAPGWRSNQYSGLLSDSFKVGEGLWLMNNLLYSHYYTTRDKNFPEKLDKLGDQIVLRGDWFQAGLSVSSKSDLLFQNFKSVNFNAGANFRVWNSGPHSIRIGILYSSRGELYGKSLRPSQILPLPYFSYTYKTPSLIVSAGLPTFLVWRPNEMVSLSLYGILPGVGTARLKFNVHKNVCIVLSWSVKKDIFYLNAYPFRGMHDLRYMTYSLKELLNYDDEREESKKFVLAYQRAGCSLDLHIDHYVALFIYNGFQFNASYYLTNKILVRSKNPDRIANSYVLEIGAHGLLIFGKSEE